MVDVPDQRRRQSRDPALHRIPHTRDISSRSRRSSPRRRNVYAVAQRDPLDIDVGRGSGGAAAICPLRWQCAAGRVVEPADSLLGLDPSRLRRAHPARAHVRSLPRSRASHPGRPFAGVAEGSDRGGQCVRIRRAGAAQQRDHRPRAAAHGRRHRQIRSGAATSRSTRSATPSPDWSRCCPSASPSSWAAASQSRPLRRRSQTAWITYWSVLKPRWRFAGSGGSRSGNCSCWCGAKRTCSRTDLAAGVRH